VGKAEVCEDNDEPLLFESRMTQTKKK